MTSKQRDDPLNQMPTARVIEHGGELVRRAHRVDLPLQVTVDGSHYAVCDWSLSGFAIAAPEQLFAVDTPLACSLMVPMDDAQVSVVVTAICRRSDVQLAAFEFVDIPANVRQILRQHIHSAIEGNPGTTAELVAAPIAGASLPLLAPRYTALHRYRRRGWAVFALLLVVAASWFYTASYRIATTGVVTGERLTATANSRGELKQLWVEVGDRVATGAPLFTVANPEQLARAAELDRSLQDLAIQLIEAQAQAELAIDEVAGPIGALLVQRQQDYQRAQQLYSQGVMPLRDFATIEHYYQATQLEFLAQQSLLRSGHQQRIAQLEQHRDALRSERQALTQRLQATTVHAAQSGLVVAIQRDLGQFVEDYDPVVQLQGERRPAVVLSVSATQALRLVPGMAAEVYAPQRGDRYAATVVAVDSPTPLSSHARERSTVTLALNDPAVELDANSRVSVWIQTFFFTE